MFKEINEQNFNETIAQGTVIIDFWAPWCGPCKLINPALEEVALERPDVTIAKVNVDDYPELAGDFGVMSIPTLLFFKDGELVERSIGAVGKNVILNKLAAQ